MISWLKIRFRLLNSYEILGKQGIEISPYQAQRFGDFFAMLPQLNGTDGFFGAVLEKSKNPNPNARLRRPKKTKLPTFRQLNKKKKVSQKPVLPPKLFRQTNLLKKRRKR